jgi:protein-L-isoaspartate O-methyltransferase
VTTGARRAPSARTSGISPRFLALLDLPSLAGHRALDVGTGAGRLALVLAAHARHVVGVDRDGALVVEARRRAAEAGLDNVEFHQGDADDVEYTPWTPDLVTAHLFASDAMIERAGRALAPGGRLAIVAFHRDQWRETGAVSRFAYDEESMRERLERAGLEPRALEVEREEQRFASAEDALAAAEQHRQRWSEDGRLARYREFVAAGGRTLTRSHLLVLAARTARG